jgi:hypothetical protein
MDTSKIIAELRAERARLDEAIISLERLSRATPPRRGRPPAWSRMTSLSAPRGENGQNGSTNSVAASPPRTD